VVTRGRPPIVTAGQIASIHKLRQYHGYGSLRISKLLGMSRETVRYYINKGKKEMQRPKLVILTYNKHHLMRKAVDSVLAGSLVPEIMVIDNTGNAESLPYLQDIHYPRQQVHSMPMGENLGTSGAWNWAMEHYRYEPFVIFANDDIEVDTFAIERLVNAAQSSSSALLFGNVTSGVTFNFCLLKTAAYERIGPFDQTFRPIYFEDDDYVHRLKLVGYTVEEVSTVTYQHVGTAHLKDIPDSEVQKHHIRFRWNDAYYTKKWGRLPGATRTPGYEAYTTPFNSGVDSAQWHKQRAKDGWVLPDKYSISVDEFIRRENYHEG
jgi:GT2 family glycosyltransferase